MFNNNFWKTCHGLAQVDQQWKLLPFVGQPQTLTLNTSFIYTAKESDMLPLFSQSGACASKNQLVRHKQRLVKKSGVWYHTQWS